VKTLQRNATGNTELKHLAHVLRGGTLFPRRMASLAVILAAVVVTTGCAHAMMMIPGAGAKRPAATEFGVGPRSSAHGLYVATLETAGQLRLRQMQTVRVAIVDGDGRAVEGATLAIDGGMPQHGHGLPTKPRMTQALSAGSYQVDGVRFNMGGWWEFKVTITSDRGVDTVTFNLSL
jgi:hypothetical protein